MRTTTRRLSALLLSATVALAAAGCGSDSGDGSASADGTEAFPGVSVSGEPGSAPTVEIADPPFTVEETTTEVLDEGDGDEVAEGDQAQLRYVGVNGSDGEEFDSSWSRGEAPVTFPLEQGGLIQGFLDGLIGQTYGSRVAIAIPPAEGYGEQGQPGAGIEGTDTLVFVVDLLQAAPEPLAGPEGTPQDAPATLPALQVKGDQPTGFKATGQTPERPSETTAFALIEGEGDEVAEGQTVTVNYLGALYPDGEVFDSSYGREPAQFPLQQGGLIQGFLDGLIGQKVGSRVEIVIPAADGYGEQGSPPAIPGDADLVFVVDILGVS